MTNTDKKNSIIWNVKELNMCKPQISQAPPETVCKLFRNIIGCHGTRFNGVNEYSKIKRSCSIWCLYWAI